MTNMIDRDAVLAIVERGEFVYQNIAALPAVNVGVKQLREAFDAGQDHGWDQGKTDACGGPEPVSNDEAFAAFLAALEPVAAPAATDPKVTALEAWIKQHGIHAEDCDTVTKQDEYDLDFDMETICTCGLTEILAALREGAEETKWLTQLTR